MGDLNVRLVSSQKQLNEFTRHLLKDVHALERMLEEEWFNEDPIHIGAEQEICLVDHHFKPSPSALQVLDEVGYENFTTELAKFNIEANLDPHELKGSCFSDMQSQLEGHLQTLERALEGKGLNYVLTGILPTIRKFDMELDNLTPLKRYDSLIKAINRMRGNSHELRINGMDELIITQDSAMLESCNTSFQVHLQVRPSEYVDKYNLAQVLAAPVLAIACNSPLLFGKRLWAETRVALFQQSIDTRKAGEHIRDRSPRVFFGNCWLENSISEMYKEDIARFRAMMMTDYEKDVLKMMDDGITPKLRALMIHNSTVYRWNRPCYGVSPNGKPHLRIENRVLPAGPTPIDEMANAAFWIGLMNGFQDEFKDVTQLIEFDEARDNFLSAARDGLNTDFTWFNGQKVDVCELIRKELIPIARQGLERSNVSKSDIDKYLDVIEGRNEKRQTGTQWVLNSHSKLAKQTTREEISVALTSSMIENQRKGIPVHQWKLADLESIEGWNPHSLLVEEFMTTDVFTVHPNDIPEFVADILDWRNIKYVPIEDDKGILKGLVTFKIMLNYFSKKANNNGKEDVTVKDLMIKNPITIHPEASITEALKLMKANKTDCVPVVKKNKLIGLITEGDFLRITASLLNRIEKNELLSK